MESERCLRCGILGLRDVSGEVVLFEHGLTFESHTPLATAAQAHPSFTRPSYAGSHDLPASSSPSESKEKTRPSQFACVGLTHWPHSLT